MLRVAAVPIGVGENAVIVAGSADPQFSDKSSGFCSDLFNCVNAAGCELVGLSSLEEAKKAKFFEFVAPHDRTHARHGGLPQEGLGRLDGKSGSARQKWRYGEKRTDSSGAITACTSEALGQRGPPDVARNWTQSALLLAVRP
jgi:hypothetical protein